MFWLNGAFRNDTQALEIADRGFLLGDGVFETILVRNGVPAFLDAHLERMRTGLEALKFPKNSLPEIERIIAQLARDNSIRDDGVARLTISRGISGRGLIFPPYGEDAVTMLITVQSGVATPSGPVFAKISPYRRPETSIAARHKTLNYLDNILARNDALSDDVGEAIMLNGHGRIACASAANIFAINEQGTVSTPPVEEGALAGIVRGKILQAGAQTGLTIREAPLDAYVLDSDFIFMTNSLIGLCPVVTAKKGKKPTLPNAIKIFEDLQLWYENCLREDIVRKAGTS